MILNQPVRNSSENNPAKAIILFTVLGILPSAIGFLLLPVYLKHYEPAEYGTLIVFNLLGSFYGAFSNLKLDTAMRTVYYDYNHVHEQRIKFIRSIFSTSLLISLLSLMATLCLSYFFFDSIFDDDSLHFYPLGLLVLVSVFIGQIPSVFYVVLKNEYRLKLYAFYVLIYIILNVICQYVLIVIYDLGIMGAILGMLLARLCNGILILIRERDLIDFKPDKEMLRRAFRFSLPFLPFVFLNWFYMNGDRVLLESLLNLEALGKYSLLIAIVGLVRLIFSALDNAFRPYFYEYFKSGNIKDNEHLHKMYFWYFASGIAAFSSILMLGTNLHLITDKEKYLSIVPLFPLACLVMLPRLLGRIPALKLVYLKKSMFISISTALAMVTLIILFFQLIPQYELSGALYAMGIMNLIQFVLYLYGAKNLIFRQVNVKPLLALFSLTLLLSFICWNGMISAGYSLAFFGMIQFLMVVLVILSFFLIYPKYKSLKVS